VIGKDLNKAKSLLEAGKLVAIPTETVYGLAANALDSEAVLGIFKAKNRPQFDPLIVHVSPRLLDLYRFELPKGAQKLIESFWPGPLTVLIPRPNFIPEIVTSGLPLVGLRMPRHPLTLELLEMLDFPIAAPSANPFMYVSPTTAKHVENQLGKQVDYILDGGPADIGLESTIVSFENPLQPCIVRLGGLEVSELEAIVGPMKMEISNNSNPKAPGQLDKHYATKVRLRLSNTFNETFIMNQGAGTAIIGMQIPSSVKAEYRFELSASGDLHEAARNLFSYLREADEKGVAEIVAVAVPDKGIGKAINDRLRRAAG